MKRLTEERLALIRRVVEDGFHMSKREDAMTYCVELLAELDVLKAERRRFT